MERLLSALGFTGIAAISVATLVALFVLNMAYSIFESFASFAWTCVKAALFVGVVALVWPFKSAFSYFKGDDVVEEPPKFDEFLASQTPSSQQYKAPSSMPQKSPSSSIPHKTPIKVFDGQPIRGLERSH